MKYIAILFVAGTAFLFLTRHHATPVAATPAGAAAPAEQHTDFLKSPIDRTHQVLDINRDRVNDPDLK